MLLNLLPPSAISAGIAPRFRPRRPNRMVMARIGLRGQAVEARRRGNEAKRKTTHRATLGLFRLAAWALGACGHSDGYSSIFWAGRSCVDIPSSFGLLRGGRCRCDGMPKAPPGAGAAAASVVRPHIPAQAVEA